MLVDPQLFHLQNLSLESLLSMPRKKARVQIRSNLKTFKKTRIMIQSQKQRNLKA
jgi:hypothetical protein